jgi:hypothetical protein
MMLLKLYQCVLTPQYLTQFALTINTEPRADIMFATLTDIIPTMPLTSTWRSEIRQEAMVFYSSSDLLSYIADKPKTASQLSILGASFFKGPWYTELADIMKPFA